jgi:hypothetical protein
MRRLPFGSSLDLSRYNQHIVKRDPSFVRGAICAAELAAEISNDSKSHMADRVLLKLNLLNGRNMRKNRRPVEYFLGKILEHKELLPLLLGIDNRLDEIIGKKLKCTS